MNLKHFQLLEKKFFVDVFSKLWKKQLVFGIVKYKKVQGIYEHKLTSIELNHF